MNPRVLLLAPSVFFIAPLLAQSTAVNEPGVPVTPGGVNQTLYTPPAGENQKLYGPQQSALIAPETAKAIAEKFRAAYGQASAPRIVVYVNRAIGAGESGLKLASRTEKVYESANGKDAPKTTTASSESTYTATDTPKPTLADQQTVREVERLVGRVFRLAGAKLADPHAAAALLADEPGVRLAGEGSAKERDALKQVADIAVEILISSKQLTVNRVSGEETLNVPDMQVTAIRLSDAAIIGQAAASDVLGGGHQAANVVRQFGMSDITEATAFALMEDMTTGAK